MATYTVKAPDGSSYSLQGPDGLDPSDAIAQVTAAHNAGTTPGADSDAPPGPPPAPLTFPQAFRAALGMNVAPVANAVGTVAAIPKVAAQMASGAVAAPVAGYAGMGAAAARGLGLTNADPASVVNRVQSALTYQPSSPIAQGLASGVSFLPGKFAQGADWAGGQVSQATGSPALGAAVNTGIQALPLALGARFGASATRPRPVPIAPEDALASASMASPQSTSAAAAAPSLTQVSPPLRQAISAAAQKSGGAINPDVLQRHIQADTLPVPMQLTDGQASQDPVQISVEQNLRGKEPSLAARFNGQNQQLVDNLQSLRDSAGPEVFSTNPVEHADTLIDAYNDKNDAAQAAIAAKYQALRDANGGQFPVDARQLLTNTTSQLHQNLLFEHAPPPVMRTLGTLADNGSMTFEQYEALRTNLARLMRSSPDGNAIAAAGIIRGAMEDLPLTPGAANLKPLADAARGAARTQFQALAADPAYNAAVNGTVAPDRFVNRFVINAPRDDVATMRQNLADDPTALQTLGVATIDHLRNAANIADNGSGNFAQAGFNKALQNIQPKLGSLVDPKTAETLQNLGDVARYTQFQPRGSFVNNSNTLVAAAAKYGGAALEHGVNIAFKGIPVGTVGRGIIQHLSTAKVAQQALAPGAGLTRLAPSTGYRPMGAAPVPRGTIQMPGSGTGGP
jgi:hypothetical protein